MALIGEWSRRLVYLLRRRAMEEELRREMDVHRAQLDDPRAFGNAPRLRDEARDAWGWRWLDELVQDTRFALRTLWHSPGFTLTAIATLALGIGVNIGMFSVVNTLLYRPLYEGADDVVAVHRSSGLSYVNYVDLQGGTTPIFSVLAASSMTFTGLDAGRGAQRALAAAVSANYFEIFGQPLALGRPFTAEEARPGAGIPVAIISYPRWRERGGETNILGSTVRVNGGQYTIVGVAREGFTGTGIPGPDVWLPLGADDPELGGLLDAGDSRELSVIGRLRSGVGVEAATAAVTAFSSRLPRASSGDNPGDDMLEVLVPMRLMFLPGLNRLMEASLVVLLMLMPGIVLMVACLNLADLLLARGYFRRQEFAIRSSLGGSRARLVRQMLTEALVLAFAGGAVGLLLSSWATDALLVILAPGGAGLTLPEIVVDWRVLAGTIAFCVAATVVFGAWPASTLTSRAFAAHVKERSGDATGRWGGMKVSHALVIGQVALSVVLLACGGLFLMSAISARTADPGFRLDGGVIAEVDPSLAGYDEVGARQYHLALLERLRTVPGVEAATLGWRFPFTSFGESRAVAPAGAIDGRSGSVGAVFNVVGRDYARVLGLPMLGGRDFTTVELTAGSSERVAIIDDELAARLWPGADALGRSIQFLDEEEGSAGREPMRVIGIVRSVKHSPGNPQPFPHVYVPPGQHHDGFMTLQLRVAGDEQAMLSTIGRVIQEFDERVPITALQTWREHLNASADAWISRAGAWVFSAFGAMALVLGAVGIYGVKSYVVSRRMREFGIRLAIGAHPRALLWQVMREGGGVTAVGIGIGLLLAVAAGRLFRGMLYGVESLEPVVLMIAPLVLLASSLLASYFPARRATNVDPTVALRSE